MGGTVSNSLSLTYSVNGDVDVIVRGTKLLLAMDETSNKSEEVLKVDHNHIESFKDLLETFNFFHSSGSGELK